MRNVNATQRRATFREVLAIREFRALYFAQTLSVIGDQLARIAVAVLVFDRTGSSALTGVSYAVSYLPWLIGGPTLCVVADRLSRRTVMIVCDCGRCFLILIAATPGCPTALLIGLVALSALLQPPFTAARAATIPEIVGEGDRYTAAATLTNATLQLAVLAGFSTGGVLTASLGANITLLVDGVTFGISALIVTRCVDERSAAHTPSTTWRSEATAGWAVIFHSERLRWLVTTSWILVGVVVVTEAIAVPYAHAHGGGATTAGLLSASMPLGTAVGALVLGRIIDADRVERAMPILAVATPISLALTALNPEPTLAATEWFVAGALSAVTVFANRIFVVAVPKEIRGRAFGVAAAGIAGAQGIGTLAVGVMASRVSPATAVGLVSAGGLLLIPLSNAKRLGLRRLLNASSRPEPLASTAPTPSCDLPAS